MFLAYSKILGIYQPHVLIKKLWLCKKGVCKKKTTEIETLSRPNWKRNPSLSLWLDFISSVVHTNTKKVENDVSKLQLTIDCK